MSPPPHLYTPVGPLPSLGAVLSRAPPPPPYSAYEITPRVRTWRQTLERCRSAAQVSLCIHQLERSIAWEKSVNKVVRAHGRHGGGVGLEVRRRGGWGPSSPPPFPS